MKERDPPRGVLCGTQERGTQRPRALAVLEGMYDDLDDTTATQISGQIPARRVQHTAMMNQKDGEAPEVEGAGLARQGFGGWGGASGQPRRAPRQEQGRCCSVTDPPKEAKIKYMHKA